MSADVASSCSNELRIAGPVAFSSCAWARVRCGERREVRGAHPQIDASRWWYAALGPQRGHEREVAPVTLRVRVCKHA